MPEDQAREMTESGTPNPDGSADLAPPPPHVSIQSVKYVRWGLACGIIGLLFVCWLGYTGREMPWWEMRWQHTDSTGYAPPPPHGWAASSIPRIVNLEPMVDLTPPLPNLSSGAIPTAADGLVNPLAGQGNALRDGAMLYEINCQMCHGRTGRGDGAVGEHYVPPPPDFHSPAVLRLTDGAVYYTITNGVLSTPIPEAAKYIPRDWHAFHRLLTDHERWEIVSYLRTLESTSQAPQPAQPATPGVPGSASMETDNATLR